MRVRDRAPVAELADRLVGGEVSTDHGVLAAHRTDEAYLTPSGWPLCTVYAHSTADVVETMRWATGHRVPVVPRGAGTGLAGGALAEDGAVVLSLERMTALRELSVDDRLAVVEPGVITADLARAADEHGLMYPVDPGSAMRSTLGGNLATNAGGFRCFKYGVTRESVLGLEVVLADGRVVTTGHRTSKGVSGYDLTSLFVGSEGTLGVITGATLRLRLKAVGPRATVAAYFPDAAAAARAPLALARGGLTPSFLELIDEVTLRALHAWQPLDLPGDGVALLLAEFDGVDADRAAAEMSRLCGKLNAVATQVTTDGAESERLLGVRRHALGALERMGRTMVEDFVVPRSRLGDMLVEIRRIAARHDVLIATVAHAGDANLHPTLLFDRTEPEIPARVWSAADDMFRTALRLGGTLTGEHGIGTLKRRWLRDELGDDGMDVHQAIKSALDPLGIMNSGKVL
ncbi:MULTISPECIES: FAD-binding oxidoreductase [unclassified Streptomyces]|uniref:FAD-binding oxidoreductase n=1 Tax=unclassified Streptomyces TaxID=2593676 RepID=UPI00073CEB02|nr:FAD-linked oxidase C-terminal domain-containing protein [Streptomyces sp. AVP053U2]ODA70178.1 putative FAD-linked oxidoreductase [Streptomyces sp. AVP053U2]